MEFDLSEEIEEAREDCKQRKKMLRKNSRDKTTLKNNQDSMENKLKQKKREKLDLAEAAKRKKRSAVPGRFQRSGELPGPF